MTSKTDKEQSMRFVGKKTVIVGAIAVAAVMCLSAMIPAASAEGSLQPQSNKLAADWLLGQQDADGWFPWTTGDSSQGSQGPSGRGMLKAYEISNDETYLDAAIACGDYTIDTHLAPNTGVHTYSDGDPRFYTHDALFLEELSQVTGDSKYADFVQTWFWDKLAGGTYGEDNNMDASAYGNHVVDARADQGYVALSPWDIAGTAVGAYAAGETAIAADLMDSILYGLEQTTASDTTYAPLGLAGAVWASAVTDVDLDPAAGVYAANDSTADLAAWLAQMRTDASPQGWLWSSAADPADYTNGDTQTTAFAVMALDAFDRATYDSHVIEGVLFIRSLQETSGEYLWCPSASPGETGNVEAHAEAIVAIAAASPADVYVDNDWTGSSLGDTVGGHIYGYDAFSTIMNGIDAATPGGTVNVADGTYTEAITIGKALTLTASSSPVIEVGDGGTGIEVTASDVAIEGFEITGPDTITAIHITSADVDGITVSNNIFTNSNYPYSSYPILNRNIALKIGEANDVTNVFFTNNDVTGYVSNVWAEGQNTDNLHVLDNDFNDIPIYKKDDTSYYGLGVQMEHGNNLRVENNTFTGNIDQGDPTVYQGSGVAYNHYAAVTWTSWFIDYYGWPQIDGGTYIKNNEMTNLYLGTSVFSSAGEISGNDIDSNYLGIQVGQVDDVYATAPSKGLAIENNNITNNYRGIWVQSFVVDGLHASFNNIHDNEEYGIKNEDADTFDATCNWWGSEDGPGGEGPGSGDTVSTNVEFLPWLDAPYPDGVCNGGYPVIDATMTATDVNGGNLAPGDAIKYTVTVTNEGYGDSPDNAGNEFEGGIPEYTTYVDGSATASSGTVATGSILWNGAISAQSSVEISYEVTVDSDIPSGTTISSQGTVNYDSDGDGGGNDAVEPTDNPMTTPDNDPTETPLGAADDTEAPVSDLTVTLDPDGYYIPASTFHLSATDDSGVWKVYYKIDGGSVHEGSWNDEMQFQVNELHGYEPGEHTVEYWAEDGVGNVESHHVETYVLDTTGPDTSISFDGIAEVTTSQVWQITSDTGVLLSASDDYTSVDEVVYRVDDGDWTSYDGSFTIQEPGMHTLYYYAKDVLGNTGDLRSTTINVGGGDPSSSCTVIPGMPDGDNGWYTSGVTIELSATDEASGVSHVRYRVDGEAWQTYRGAVTVDGDGRHTLEYYAVDNVGNDEAVNTERLKIDLYGPEITMERPSGHLYLFDRAILPTPSGRNIAVGSLTIEASVRDVATSGVASTSLYLDGDLRATASQDISHTLDETLMGMHTITIEAYDVAGNKATETATATIYNIQLFNKNS